MDNTNYNINHGVDISDKSNKYSIHRDFLTP